jgi:hypothetical protein
MNRQLSALVSFTAWVNRQEPLANNPARRLEHRKTTRRGDRAIPRARLETLFTDDRHTLRERVLWRMLYETAARAEELRSAAFSPAPPCPIRVSCSKVPPRGGRHPPDGWIMHRVGASRSRRRSAGMCGRAPEPIRQQR